MAASILTANPSTVFVVAYHPTNSSYTTTDPMKNAFPNAFYTNPFISPTNRFMPSAMINRRVWGGVERIQSTTSWTSEVGTIKGENSPVNVGLSSSYDAVSKLLSITVEMYFTADVTNSVTLFTMLTEDGIIATQSGGTANYVHNHVFRAAFPQPTPAQWGEPVTSATTAGSFYTVTYTYDNSTTNFDMTNCELVAFARNAADEEIITGNGTAVGLSTGITALNQETASYSVYPNPVNETANVYFNLSKSADLSYQLTDATGQLVRSNNLGRMEIGNQQISINTSSIAKGIYFLNIKEDAKITSIKIVK